MSDKKIRLCQSLYTKEAYCQQNATGNKMLYYDYLHN